MPNVKAPGSGMHGIGILELSPIAMTAIAGMEKGFMQDHYYARQRLSKILTDERTA